VEHGPNVPLIRLRSRRGVATLLKPLRLQAIPPADDTGDDEALS
jgi:hypothetical protein